MENHRISTPHLQKIALIVPYIGPLPPYFPAWLESAKANPDVDFLFYTDQDISIDAPNFRVTKTSLEALRERFSRTLNRPVSIPIGYKLCDYKPLYGLLFEEELRGYDFWGYCDIDLVFGRIRHFLTDERLSAYERLYPFGHFCVYRNNEKMRHAFELPGSWFTLDEVFGPTHIAADEFFFMSQICRKNHIAWYTVSDYADLDNTVRTRLEVVRGHRNYPVQAFYYFQGRAFQRYLDGDVVGEKELLYIHWFKRRPVLERPVSPEKAVIITPKELLVRPPEELTPENMLRWNPPTRAGESGAGDRKARAEKFMSFFRGSFAHKKILVKRKLFYLLEIKIKRHPYL